ncbi:redox-sensing transcriptional repressor Rex [Ferroacidibacillus organovorans]|uniref:Redox-sensing transcriptional repressor Rex n=1 Tax=Ferroacidibacillus organovorans TaxID=1765683 RepID=A0A853KD81_9BACL|nr:redox-sensing transcriptional repressor Rex [Ferroacidibacillus organovorans]KYP80126.1 redox-sensing transcriptional repressor Rex [Ferroacidibacillus organovorans]OAG95002.1 redox-sensing transcriptional repressor Rex [Ferroacidibacillus organovorans]
MAFDRLPVVTARRLPLYYRYLQTLVALGKQRVSSAEVSAALHIDSATIRRDFSYLGELGRKGYGYNVDYLLRFLQDFLKQDEIVKVILVGVGNLGTALCRYDFYRSKQMNIVAAFDVDPLKLGQEIEGIPVHAVKDLESFVKREGVEIAILAVPASSAQVTADLVVRAGVLGILNFTPRTLSVPPDVRVHHIDVTTELQILVYYLKRGQRQDDPQKDDES